MRRWHLGPLTLLAAVAVAAVALGVTFAAFTATVSNSGNSFSAASSFGPLTATGSYTGNGANNRAISVGFQPDFVLVKADAAQPAVATTSVVPAGNAKALSGAVAPTTGLISSLSATGFTVGTSSQVNASDTTYYWLAVKAQAGAVNVGSYTGVKGPTKSITGVGFSPDYVAILGSGATQAVQRFRGAARSYQFDADTGTTARIQSFDTNGFTVANSTEVNGSGSTFYYFAVKGTTGGAKVGSYTGNNTDGTVVSGVGFLPEAVLIRADDTATARRGALRTAPTGSSSLFFDASSSITNGVEAFNLGGFTLGTDPSVNASAPTYYYLAFR